MPVGRSRRHKGYSPPIEQLGRSRTVMWIVADEPTGHVREARRLEPGTDLFDALLAESLRYHRAGWEFTERPFFNTEFFVKRAGQAQLRVHFSGDDPALEPLLADGRYEREHFYARFPGAGIYG